jgi:hypothetical protein
LAKYTEADCIATFRKILDGAGVFDGQAITLSLLCECEKRFAVHKNVQENRTFLEILTKYFSEYLTLGEGGERHGGSPMFLKFSSDDITRLFSFFF